MTNLQKAQDISDALFNDGISMPIMQNIVKINGEYYSPFVLALQKDFEMRNDYGFYDRVMNEPIEPEAIVQYFESITNPDEIQAMMHQARQDAEKLILEKMEKYFDLVWYARSNPDPNDEQWADTPNEIFLEAFKQQKRVEATHTPRRQRI